MSQARTPAWSSSSVRISATEPRCGINIFVLDEDPQVAARSLCNAHVVKMCVETAQLLVTAYPRGMMPYRHTHFNHPCAKWVRESLSNFKWLLVHGLELCEEYTRRYGRIHKTQAIIELMLDSEPVLSDIGLTSFARAIKEPWKAETVHLSVVEAYRTYYVADKARFARWSPRAAPPEWWPFEER